MTSLESAHSYIQRLDTLSPVRNSVKGIPISPDLQSAVDIMERRSRIFSDRLSGLYLTFTKATLQDALADLLSAKTTPEQFAQRLEAAADEIRRDPEIYKPPKRGVPN